MRLSHTALAYAFLFLAFIGFIDASYLSIKHYTKDPLMCFVVNGCDKVTNSSYAAFYGVPLAYIGAAYYTTLLILGLWHMRSRERRAPLMILSALTGAGFAASAWFVYLQFFVIEAICMYCMISAVTATLLFICAVAMILYHHDLFRD